MKIMSRICAKLLSVNAHLFHRVAAHHFKEGKKASSLLILFLIFLGNLCLGVLLWWLAAGMDTLLEQVANIEFWADMFVRQLLALIRGSNGHVPMTRIK